MVIQCMWLFINVASLYRDYEKGKQRQVEKLGAGKTVDGSINAIIDVTAKKEYQYFLYVHLFVHFGHALRNINRNS